MANILVIEDDLEARDAATIWLELEGHTVTVANDGREGLARAFSEIPDLIITDLVMPRLDGVETIKLIRAIPTMPSTLPIIAMTGFQMALAEEAIMAGANRIISKPYDPDILLANIKSLLKARSASAGS
ncbi:MAG TPA: response regulator [Blastocatellia bacterium]